jgi:hypothetical protein
MRKRLRTSPAMVVASIALMVALGSTSYAAMSLPAKSVGTRQGQRVSAPAFIARLITSKSPHEISNRPNRKT